MFLTREQQKEPFNHVLDFVLGRGDGSPLKLSLTEAGINDITCLLSLTVDEVEDLEYLKTGVDTDDE